MIGPAVSVVAALKAMVSQRKTRRMENIVIEIDAIISRQSFAPSSESASMISDVPFLLYVPCSSSETPLSSMVSRSKVRALRATRRVEQQVYRYAVLRLGRLRIHLFLTLEPSRTKLVKQIARNTREKDPGITERGRYPKSEPKQEAEVNMIPPT